MQSGDAGALPMGWARLAVTVAARGTLFAILGMLTWALLPTALGWTPTTVMTGSMEPRIHPGDVVVSRPAAADATTLNHILLVDDPDHAGRLRLHRFAEFAPDGNLILRGDANSANDSTPVAPSAVHGVAVLRIPFVGLPVVWFAEKNWGPFAAALAAVAGLTLAAASGSSTPPSHRRARPKARRARTTRTIVAVAVTALVLCPGMLMTAPAQARFSGTAPPQTGSFSALASFPCPAAIAPPDNPNLFYRFNEGSGTVATDASQNPQNGTLHGTTWAPGSCRAEPGPALNLVGSGGYVSRPQGTAQSTYTLEIWFKTSTTTGGKLIGWNNGQTGSDRHLYLTSNGAIVFGVASSNGDNNASAIMSAPDSSGKNKYYKDGAWHQATVTMSGTKASAAMTLYVDGIEIDKKIGVSSSLDFAGYWRIGYDTFTTSNVNSWPGVSGNPVLVGTVDNAAVYPAALSASQVRKHWNDNCRQFTDPGCLLPSLP